MTEQERAELEQAAKHQRWGSKERVALVAEVLRQKRMVEWLCTFLGKRTHTILDCPPNIEPGNACECGGPDCADCWKRSAEQAVAEEISPKA